MLPKIHDFVDASNRELARHGTTAFPIACYYDDLSADCCPWHWHEELEAGIISDGEPQISIGKSCWRIRPGDGFFVNSGVLHSGQSTRDGECRLHSLVFHERLVGGSRESIYYQKYVQPLTGNAAFEGCVLHADIPWQAQALEEIETAYQSCLSGGEDHELTVRSTLSELLAILVKNIPSEQTPPTAKAIRDAERIKRMLQFIEEHYSEEITAAEIAASASVSESECLRCFRATIGTTPIRYLREYRIERASQLLSCGQIRPAEAAAACGFQDMSYFDRTFRQLRSCTPSEYARRVRG